MFKNYLKVAFRISRKTRLNPSSTFRISSWYGCFSDYYIYCRNELNYNKFFSQHENIYQIEIGDDYYTAAPLAQ